MQVELTPDQAAAYSRGESVEVRPRISQETNIWRGGVVKQIAELLEKIKSIAGVPEFEAVKAEDRERITKGIYEKNKTAIDESISELNGKHGLTALEFDAFPENKVKRLGIIPASYSLKINGKKFGYLNSGCTGAGTQPK